MSSHVVVISTALQRVRVNVSPGTHMTDILAEACKTLGPRYTNYGFKHNNKSIDMSRRFRETNLASGAKLELVAISRSPVPVPVALQVGEERLRDTFPSDTSLWQILRRFESKNKMKYNFTESSWISDIKSGSGKLLYEQPVVNILGKEVSTLVELQKSLAQFGVNGGNVLIRLTLRKTEKTFADAAAEIDEFFRDTSTSEPAKVTNESTDEQANVPSNDVGEVKDAALKLESSQPENDNKGEALAMSATSSASETATGLSEDHSHHAQPHHGIVPPRIFQAMAESEETTLEQKEIARSNLTHVEKLHEARTNNSPSQKSPNTTAGPDDTSASVTPSKRPITPTLQPDNMVPGPNGRPILITKAPSGDTPAAAQAPFDEMDYEPSQAHARSVLSRLQNESQNKRLLSDAEIELMENEKLAKVAITEISLRVRFPDQTTLTSKFNAEDTAGGLYKFVSSVINAKDEPFVLSIYGLGDVPQAETKRLIKDLKISTNTQVTFRWADGVSESARKPPVLREEYAQKAIDIPLPPPNAFGARQDPSPVGPKNDVTKESGGGKGKGLGAFKKFLPGGKK